MAEQPPRADVGRLYYCGTCGRKQPVYFDPLGSRDDGGGPEYDIVCLKCHTILVTFEQEPPPVH